MNDLERAHAALEITRQMVGSIRADMATIEARLCAIEAAVEQVRPQGARRKA